MNEWDAIRYICAGRYRRNFVLPNYTPFGWWECDVFEVTAAGFFREYEVKLTLADFRRDQLKARNVWEMADSHLRELAAVEKHKLLAAGDPRAPHRFWFVTPSGLLEKESLPAFAGLIEIEDSGACEPRHYRWRSVERRPAPVLHDHRLSPRTLEHAKSVIYYRLHNLILAGRQPQPSPPAEERQAVEA